MVKSPLYSAFFFNHTQFFISLLSHLFSQVKSFELEPTPQCLGGRQTQRNSSPLHHHSFSMEEGWFTDLCGLYHQSATWAHELRTRDSLTHAPESKVLWYREGLWQWSHHRLGVWCKVPRLRPCARDTAAVKFAVCRVWSCKIPWMTV